LEAWKGKRKKVWCLWSKSPKEYPINLTKTLFGVYDRTGKFLAIFSCLKLIKNRPNVMPFNYYFLQKWCVFTNLLKMKHSRFTAGYKQTLIQVYQDEE